MKQDRREFLTMLGLLVVGGSATRSLAAFSAQDPPKPLKGRRTPAVFALGSSALDPVLSATRSIKVVPSRWRIIVGHHSGIGTGNAAIYDRAHRARGMEHGLAYHFVIGNGTKSGDGEIEVGSRWLQQLDGGHVHDDYVNHVGIGICCVGNFEETQPTPAQLRSFIALVDFLEGDVLKTPVRFAVHREINPGRTVCPGRHFPVAAMHTRFG